MTARVALVALLAAGCASTQAVTVPDGPPLEMPAPPPRALAPVEPAAPVAEADPAPEPDSGPPPVVVASPVPAPPRPAPDPVAAEAPLAEPPAPVRDFRAADGDGAALAAVRNRLGLAARDRDLVDYNRLSGPARLQYEQSRRFSQQAEAAIRDGNLAFAATLADKAAALAAELAGR